MIGKFVAKCCDDNCVPFENPIPVTSLAQAYVPFQKICGYFVKCFWKRYKYTWI